MNFIKPDFNNCNLCISSTFAKYLGVPDDKPIIPELEALLKKDFKNVVFIIFDGLGMYPLEKHAAVADFLRKHTVKTLLSTFPSTTTNATTSMITNKYPLEHGWFGWNLNFPEVGRNVELFTGLDAETGKKVDCVMPISDHDDYYFYKGKGDIAVFTVMPPFFQVTNPDRQRIITNLDELYNRIADITALDCKKFVYCYFGEPDMTMHDYGVSSTRAEKKIKSINDTVRKMAENFKDTLFVITADHGQVDVAGYTEFYNDKELNEVLECPAFLDSRSPAFRVKRGEEGYFEKTFTERYGEDFVLYKSKDLIAQGFFGANGTYGNLLGDYIGIGTFTHKQFLPFENSHRYKGHHCSLTEEMEVPLIVIDGQ